MADDWGRSKLKVRSLELHRQGAKVRKVFLRCSLIHFSLRSSASWRLSGEKTRSLPLHSSLKVGDQPGVALFIVKGQIVFAIFKKGSLDGAKHE